MKRYLVNRLVSLLPVLVIVGLVVFFLVHITPGDPAAILAGPDASPEQLNNLRTTLGLNDPLPVQLWRWAIRAVQGDLGDSIFFNMKVTTLIAQKLEPTLLLSTAALLIAVCLGVGVGVLAAARHNTWVDQMVMVLTLFGVSIPSFWLGLNLMLVLGVKLRLLPVAGYVPLAEDAVTTLKSLVMPAISLGFIESALIARMTRSAMLDVLIQDYVRTALAKGLTERVVIFRHALRNAMLPIITVIGNTLAVLLGGSIVTETVFAIPGFGQLVIQAVSRRDYPLIQGAVLFVAIVYVLVNLLVDLLYVWIDPRIRYV